MQPRAGRPTSGNLPRIKDLQWGGWAVAEETTHSSTTAKNKIGLCHETPKSSKKVCNSKLIKGWKKSMIMTQPAAKLQIVCNPNL